MNKFTVEAISTKEINTKFGIKKAYSLMINAKWYNAGFECPEINSVKKGDVVEGEIVDVKGKDGKTYTNFEIKKEPKQQFLNSYKPQFAEDMKKELSEIKGLLNSIIEKLNK